MGLMSVLSYARKLIEERVGPGDTVIDATVGNGVDTLFLARLTGEQGNVYGFDIQPEALAKTEEKLASETYPLSSTVHLLLRSHAEMKEALPDSLQGEVSAVMFNLGYLPGYDQDIITHPDSTLPALNAAIALLKPRGILTLIVYPGHEGGQPESVAVLNWASKLSQEHYHVLSYRFLNRGSVPSYLIAVEKRQ